MFHDIVAGILALMAMLQTLLGADYSLESGICRNDLLAVSRSLDSGRDVNAEFKTGFAKGHTPLTLALTGHDCGPRSFFLPMTSLLIERGADVSKAASIYGNSTPLHEAAVSVDIASARLLLEHGADTNATNIDGKTPLMIVSSAGFAFTKLLIDAGADPTKTSKKGQTALATAIVMNEPARIELIRRAIEKQ